MGKISKKATAKHDASLSPALRDLIKSLESVSLAEIPKTTQSLSVRWPIPRGDLYNWIAPLNRFDTILQEFNTRYGLTAGVQNKAFGVSQLLEGSPGLSEYDIKQLGFGPEGDRELVESILRFSKLLLEKCGNRALYNSSDRLNDLLNTTSLCLLHCALRTGLCLAQRYRDRFRSFPTLQPLIGNYGLDLDKLRKLCSSVEYAKSSGKQGPPSPIKLSKSRDKPSQSSRTRRGSAAVNPNDFRSLCRDGHPANGSGKSVGTSKAIEAEWQEWGSVSMTFTSLPSTEVMSAEPVLETADQPHTPSPQARRASSSASKLSQLATFQGSDVEGPLIERNIDAKPADTQRIDLSAKDLMKTSIDQLLSRNLPNIPQANQYDLLHKLRIAYGLITSAETRRQVLAIRLLAIANVTCVYPEASFPVKLFGQENDPAKQQQLISQISNLLRTEDRNKSQVPLHVQTLALEALTAMSKQKSTCSEVLSAFGTASDHGMLLSLTQRGVRDLGQDNETTENAEGDEWRDIVFQSLKTCMDATPPHNRPTDNFASPAILACYVSALKQRTSKALKIHGRIIEFLKWFPHQHKDNLATLLNNRAFEAIVDLLDYLSGAAMQQVSEGTGFPEAFKTPSTDYQTPYLHQQLIRAIVDLINDVSTHQGTHADRVIRSFVDSAALLKTLRRIMDNGLPFGAHTWSEVIKCVCGFLHAEPTSYTLIHDAGIVQSIFRTIVPTEDTSQASSPKEPGMRSQDTGGEPLPDSDPQTSSAPVQAGVTAGGSGDHTQSSTPARIISSRPSQAPQGLFATSDAIINVAQAFSAICLTNAGFDAFQASGVLEKFFEIFESPAHVLALKDANVIQILGSTFDELVRHHPNLRSAVCSAVIVMVSRVSHICRGKDLVDAGPKLVVIGDGAMSSVLGGVDSLRLEIRPDVREGAELDSSSIILPNGSKLNLVQHSDCDEEPSDLSHNRAAAYNTHGLTANDYVPPSMGFLSTLFENQTLCASFTDSGGVDLVLDLVTLPSLPVNEPGVPHPTQYELASTIHMMTSEKPHLVLPALLQRALYACKQLENFSQHQPRDLSCYFAPVLHETFNEAEKMDIDNGQEKYILDNGTRLVKSLHAVDSLVRVLAEVFGMPSYGTRSSQLPFLQANLSDIYAELSEVLGRVSAACIRERIAMQESGHDTRTQAARPLPRWLSDESVPAELQLQRQDAETNGASSHSSVVPAPSQPEPDTKATSKAVQDAATSNAASLLQILTETPHSITTFLKLLGRGLVGKRRADTVHKQNLTRVATAIANALHFQLDPAFFQHNAAHLFPEQNVVGRFEYLAIALENLNDAILDSAISSDQIKQCNTSVLIAFKKVGGLRLLDSIGKECFGHLSQNKVAQDVDSPEIPRLIKAANAGLKTCLEILDALTSSKCIIDSVQTLTLKTTDTNRPFYFVPDQLLLELRSSALPLTRLIWDSEYIDQAPGAIMEKLVSILNHVLSGDHEHEAYTDQRARPSSHTPRRTTIDPNKLDSLKARGVGEDLAQEALYRCNNSVIAAEEYCKALTRNPRRQRCPVPSGEYDDVASPSSIAPVLPSDGLVASSGVDVTVANLLSAIANNDRQTSHVTNADHLAGEVAVENRDELAIASDATGPSAMSLDHILNDAGPSETERSGQAQQGSQPLPGITSTRAVPEQVPTVQSLEEERDSIREDLAERCNNVLNNHNLTFELADLLTSATKKLSDEPAKAFREGAMKLLITALVSLQAEEGITEAKGQRIAASAHLIALLLQDKAVYESAESILRDTFEVLLMFVKPPFSEVRINDASLPWIGSIMLIFERMLSRDAEPDKVTWHAPSDMEVASAAQFDPTTVFEDYQKEQLLVAVLDFLPRVGKDKSLALSLARILVPLTRERNLALMLAEKRNLQRLFVMVKQLATGTNERLQSAFMTILRHIIEDDEMLKNIMRSEIVASFGHRVSSRQTDTTTFVRELYHLVLRSPKIFVDVANEKIKLQRYEGRERSQNLVLKSTDQPSAIGRQVDTTTSEPPQIVTPGSEPANSVEVQADTQNEEDIKGTEIKAPVVEHPDGVIHFLLSELLAYKEVEDKEVLITHTTPADTGSMVQPEADSSEDSLPSDSPNPPVKTPSSTKPRNSNFKVEDHPIYVYRCFLLQCLAELLLSYNRTKIEFINFSRKADPLAMTPSKPRSGVLNYLLTTLVPGCIEPEDTIAYRKKTSTSSLAMKVVVALCAKTGEITQPTAASTSGAFIGSEETDSEPELTFVRRFALEHAIKAFKDAGSSSESLSDRYSRLLGLADLFHRLLSKPTPSDPSMVQAPLQNSSHKALSRMMFEKNLISILTSSLTDVDLTFTGAKRVIKYILKPLNELTITASHLSMTSSTPISSALGTSEDDISSASSVSEMHDEREETPDLFRNSALGILEPNRQDEYESDSDGNEDEDMYEEQYLDEMEYEDGMQGAGPNNGEVVSDDEMDDRLQGAGPMEGLPGDVPMDIEFVMNGDRMDVDTEDDDEDEEEDDDEGEDDDDDSDEDDEEDDEGEDLSELEFEVDDAVESGEINGDNENASLGDHADAEDDWEDEGDGDEEIEYNEEDEAQHIGPDFGDDIDVDAGPAATLGGPHVELNNLLQVLNGNADEEVNMSSHLNEVLGHDDDGPPDDEEDEDEEEGDDEEGDEVIENDDLGFDAFNEMIDASNDFLGHNEQWPWEDAPFHRRHRHVRGSGQMPGFLNRHLRMPAEVAQLMNDSVPPIIRRHAGPPRPTGDDGTNPLLQRPVASIDHHNGPVRPRMPLPSHVPAAVDGFPLQADLIRTVMRDRGSDMTFPPGADPNNTVLDAIMSTLHRGGEPISFQDGQLHINLTAQPHEARHFMRNIQAGYRYREDSSRMTSLEPRTTTVRWQEEARLLYGNAYIEVVQRVVKALMSVLVPPAQEEEKIRRKKLEAEAKEREEAEKKKAEMERKFQEESEREAAAKAEADRKAANEAAAAAAAAAAAEAQAAELARADAVPESNPSGTGEAMEGIEATNAIPEQLTQASIEDAQTVEGGTADDTPRVFTTIRGRPLDITGMEIDAEYLEALPEELREEVIMQQYTAQREQAQGQGGEAPTDIDQEFLEALPEDIREEIRQQEAHARRRRERDAARRQTIVSGGPAQAEDMDNDNFLATLDPALRRAILAEQPQEILQQLDPRHAAEGRAHARHIFRYQPVGRETRDEIVPREIAERETKRQIVQMVDKSGVATLLRLMFVPHQGSLKHSLYTVVRNVCGHRQTRVEVVSLLLTILKEGSTDVSAVERSLASLSLRAKASAPQKTPQPLKRTLSLQPTAGLGDEMTPSTVINQCLAVLVHLSQHDPHVKSIFLREVEIGAIAKSKSKKGKGKENKATKYPLNDLISLLDRKLLMESASCLQTFSQLLSTITSPLVMLLTRKRMKDEEAEGKEKDPPATDATQIVSQESTSASQQVQANLQPQESVEPAEGEVMHTNADINSASQTVPVTLQEAPSQSAAEVRMTSPQSAVEIVSQTPADAEKAVGGSRDNSDPDEVKARKSFEPPVIPEHNLRLVVGILVAQECGRETFNTTLEAILNLSFIPGTSEVFITELTGQAKTLSHVILTDLDDLLPQIQEAQSGTDLQGIASSRFSPASSDQSKLLRILTALDYISMPKRPDIHEPDEADKSKAKSVLNSSYESLSLGSLWDKLSQCLTAIREKENIFSFATILLPLIESLMVVCKNTSLKDAPIGRQVREQSVTSPGPESFNDLEDLFFTFTTEHRKILNEIVRQNPKLMQGVGSFALLVKNPKVLEFDNKRNYFNKQIHSKQREQRHPQPPLQLSVRRDQVFLDSFKSLYFKTAEEMKYGKLNIRFHGEEGVDAGGVTREWYQVLARGMFNPNYALWEPVASDKTTFHPSRLSGVNSEHLMFFKFIGRIIGKALHEGRVLDCHFSRAVYKKLLGKETSLKDMESMDQSYFKSLEWILSNDVTDVLSEQFAVVSDDFGVEQTIDLIPNGRNIDVTEENKHEYVQKLVEYRLSGSCQEQLANFKKGVDDLVPESLLSIFNEQELELLISGTPQIDVNDWKANTEYHGYQPSSPQVVWFWRLLNSMADSDRALILQFITGTSKVPLDGFKALEGMSGITKCNIHRQPNKDALPTSHTCFNQLDLPCYESFDELKTKVMAAINFGGEYFGFA